MKTFRKRMKYILCVLFVAVMLLPVLPIPARAATTASYQLGFVDENGNRIYGTITVDGVYISTKTYTTTQYNPVATFEAETGDYYDVTFQNDDGYYRFFTFYASSDDLNKDKSNTNAALTKVPYTVTVKYKDGTAAVGVQVKADNFGTNTTTDSNGQCTVYGTYAGVTTVQVFDGLKWVTQTIRPTTPGRKDISFTLDTYLHVPVKVLLNGQDVTNITEVTAVSGDETIKSTSGSLQLKENVTYSISATHCEETAGYLGFPVTSKDGFSTGSMTYTVPENPSAITLNAVLNKPVAEYYNFSQQQEPFLFTDGGVQTVAFGKRISLDIQNRIADATYSFESSDTSVLSVSGSTIMAASAGEATLKVTVEYLGSTAVSSTTVRIPKMQITRPLPTDLFKEYTYNGDAQTFNIAANDAYTVTGNKQTNAGTYPVTIALTDKKNTEWAHTASTDDIIYNFIINPAELSYTKPTAPELTYNGEDRPLLNAISVENATVEYALSQNEDSAPSTGWSASVPTGKKVGVYYVWYKIQADGNHIDVAPTAVKAEIKKATLTAEDFIFEPLEGAVFDGTEKAATVRLKDDVYGAGEVRVQYVLLPDGTAATQIPVNAGKYRVAVSVEEGENYNAIQELTDPNWEFQIEQEAGTASVSVQDSVYGEETVITPQSHTNGTDAVTYWFKAKDAEDSTYATTMPSDVGEYTVKAVFSETQNYKEAVAFDDFEILQRAITVTADNAGKTYGDDDPELTWKVTGGTKLETDSLSIDIRRDEGENADDYTITVSQDEGENANYDITFVPGTFTIQKAELAVTAEDKTVDYGDAVPTYTVTYSGFKNGDDQNDLAGALAFDGDYVQFADKGDYTITPKGYESGNYTFDYQSGTLTVGAKKITVTIDARSSVYGEEIVVLTAADDGIVNGDTNVYSLATNATETSDVGKYDITGTVLDDNYSITFENGEDAYEITKATAVAETAPAAAAGLTYTGAEQTLISAGATGDGEMLYRLEDQSWSNAIPAAKSAGTYDVWYKIAGDKNHKDSEPVKIEAEIAKADPGIGAVTAGIVSDTLETSAIVLSRENESIEGTLAVDVGQSLVWGDNAIAYTFTPKDTANYKTVNDITAVTVQDTVAPTGTLSVSARSWTEFLNTITFGLFFKEDQTLSVEAADSVSGVAGIEYYETEDALDLDGVKALANETWTEMRNGKVSIAAEDAKQFIYYIRITDKAGNRAYLATNGAEFDTTAPAVGGVAGGVTYYTTQVVTVTDKNLDTVTLNGEAVTGAITLEGNREATYTIEATDKAGNTTTVTVKTAAIADITGLLEEKTEDNVTSEDKANLQILADTVTELLKDEDLTNAEKAELEAAKAGAEARLDVIEAAQDAIETEATGKVQDVTAENVKLENKEDLSAARTDLEKALDDNGGNYTEEEKKAVEEEIARIEEALRVIEKVEAVEKSVSELPSAVEPEDDESVAAVDKAKEAYEELTEYERSLIDAETKEKLDRLSAEAAAYDIIRGDGSCWIKGSGDGLTFVANGAFGKFVGIEIDGKELAKANYDARSGSTVLTLKASYLDTQSVGEHTITVVYTDGRTDGTFRIAANPGIPATGDDSNIMLYGSVFTVSLAALVVLRLAEKKRKQEKA